MRSIADKSDRTVTVVPRLSWPVRKPIVPATRILWN
jgi:hypothetical protein